jgi:hypothetical protein
MFLSAGIDRLSTSDCNGSRAVTTVLVSLYSASSAGICAAYPIRGSFALVLFVKQCFSADFSFVRVASMLMLTRRLDIVHFDALPREPLL